MMHLTTDRTTLVLALALASLGVACGKTEHAAPAPAKPSATARPKLARTAAAGERLADVDRSKLKLDMVKDKDFAQPVSATLALRDGRLTLDGPNGASAKLTLDLTTFDSSIPLRNERVQKIFFETSGAGWDVAELTIPKLPDAAVASLKEKGRALHATVEGDLKLHGRTAKVSVPVDATTGPDGTITVKSSVPFEVHVSDFGLTDNLKRLSSLCMHDSIEDAVKVEVAVEFPAAK